MKHSETSPRTRPCRSEAGVVEALEILTKQAQ
jgi:hypothetical protein